MVEKRGNENIRGGEASEVRIADLRKKEKQKKRNMGA